MSFDSIALIIGYGMLFTGGIALASFFVALVAGLVNEQSGKTLRAIQNTYWWIRWLRWHRIARARKEKL